MKKSYKWMFISSIIVSVMSLVMATTVFFVKPNNQSTNPPTTQQQPSSGEQTPTEPAVKLYDMSPDEKYLYFGEYPQSLKSEYVSITSKTPDRQGYFWGDDGNRYYLWNTKYFKVEPLKWRVLTQEDGKAFVVSDLLLDYLGGWVVEEEARFANDYQYSNLRKYLINDFYNRAFSEEEKEIIKQTLVDNSLSQSSNPNADVDYVFENTNDYVFALSYQDIVNPEYGFAENDLAHESRYWKMTDFAEMNGGTRFIESYISDWYGVEEGTPEYEEYLKCIGNADTITSFRCNYYDGSIYDGWDLNVILENGEIHYFGGPTVDNMYSTYALPAMWIEL